jgi:hypothetical protein
MTLTSPAPPHLGLKTGPEWESFEELRGKHSEKLGQIQPGTFARLKVKRRSFVIVDEVDFQRFEMVMSDIDALVDKLEVLQSAANVAERGLDDATVTMLKRTIDLATKAAQNLIKDSLSSFRPLPSA